MTTVAIVALGNTLMGDDGVGPAVLEQLVGLLPPQTGDKNDKKVELISGEISGLALIPVLKDFDRIIFIDAARLKDAEPGEVRVLSQDSLDLALPAFATAHDVGLKDLVSAVHLLSGQRPSISLVAIQIKNVAIGIGLSPEVELAVDRATRAVLAHL